MALRYKTRIFAFRKSDTNEADRVFSVFSDEYGRMDLFAKAIRKSVSKLRGGIDVFSFSEAEFIQGKNRKTLTDARAFQKFAGIRQNVYKFAVANRIARVIDSFIKGEEKDGKLFCLLEEVFNKLDNLSNPKARAEFLYYYFLWNFLTLQGYGPEVVNCISCKKRITPGKIYFSYKEGGVICKECSPPGAPIQELNSDIIKTLRIILERDWSTLAKLKVEEASWTAFKKVSNKYLNFKY